MPESLTIALKILGFVVAFTIVADTPVFAYLSRKLHKMSQAYDELKADLDKLTAQDAAKAAQIVDLQSSKTALESANDALNKTNAALTEQLAAAQAAAGTPDAALTALDAEVKAALDPVAPPAPETPPAAT